MAEIAEIISEKAYLALQEEIGLVSESNQTDFYFSEKWSMHELIAYLCAQTGAANIKLSSFSISEDAIRMFVLLKDLGLLKELTILLDYTTKTHKTNLMFFLQNVADKVRTTPNHSKVVLIESESTRFFVLSSQNLNKNHRVECGVVSCIDKEFEILNQKFDKYFEKAVDIWT